jgi:hypothetical protein
MHICRAIRRKNGGVVFEWIVRVIQIENPEIGLINVPYSDAVAGAHLRVAILSKPAGAPALEIHQQLIRIALSYEERIG